MFQKINRQEKGFTIIEVLIVLAIAGLIMLIVFLAVPALQRNSRNTQRRNDVGKILSAMVEYANNNNGQMPAAGQFATALQNAELGIYNGAGLVTYGTPVPATDENHVTVVVNAKCNAAQSGTLPQNRAVAALFKVETGNGTADQCQDS